MQLPARVRRLREDGSNEGGFTLIELLVGISVGSIVIAAAVTLVIMSMDQQARVSDRVAGLSSGRIVLEQIEQRLHSATCFAIAEYSVNGVTGVTSAVPALAYAGPTEMAYFADISDQNGATNVASSVGFVPYLRYFIVDQGATARVAGRQTRLVDGWRAPTTTSQPYNYTLGVAASTGFSTFPNASVVTASGNGPSTMRTMTDLITNATSGATSLPFFQYYDGPTQELSPSSSTGGLLATDLNNVDHIRINFRRLADSGNDAANPTALNSGATALDNRTVQFQSDIYLRNPAGDCANY